MNYPNGYVEMSQEEFDYWEEKANLERGKNMAIDYEGLTRDLIRAKEAAEKAVTGEDGGTCNLDCLTLQLKGYREKKVIEAVKAAGLYTRGKREWLGKRYFIQPPKAAQGNDRVRQVNAMYEVMNDLEYDCLMFEQMD